jgi:MFS family permease
MVLCCGEGAIVTSSRAAFRWLWAGQTASMLGTAISSLAIPTYAIVVLGVSPFAVGLLGAVQFAAFPVLGLFAGVWVDRWSRRSTMLAADAVRALAIGSIPVAAFAHVLGYAQLLVVASITGVAAVFFEVAYQSLVPAIVARGDLERANARLQLTRSIAEVGGTGLAGALIALIGAALAIVIDAVSFLVSFGSLLAMRVRETHLAERIANREPFIRELRDGIDVVLRSPVWFRIVGATATFNLGISVTGSVYLLYLYRMLHLSPAVAGALLAVSNLGFAGAFFAPRIARRFGVGKTLVATAAIAAISQLLLPLALVTSPLPVLFAAELAITACIPIYNITQVSLRQRTIPAELLGRANATLKTIVTGVFPIGTLAGGALGGTIGIVPTLVAGTLITICAIPWLLAAPIRALRADPAEEPAARLTRR